MLDHIGLTVADAARARAFYDRALAPLGITVMMTGPEHAGYGSQGKPYFWIGTGPSPAGHVHVAFTTPDRKTVDAFHAAALAAGGRDNGGPGLRPHYHPDYYAAFVLDPDGHNIEAVCHKPE
jgi:catechol 2,3-dioxygenase-like lactoylglutathione lyase family enzyme